MKRAGHGSRGGDRKRWIVAGVALFSVLPLLVLIGRACARDWPEPLFESDLAAVELAVRETLDGERSLGMYSRFGWAHPGPALFVLLAPAYAALSQHGYALVVGALLLNIACVALAVEVTRRRLGIVAAGALAVAAGLLFTTRSVYFFTQPWPPYQIVTMTLLFLVAAAAVAEGSTIAAGWAAVVGSVAIQSHLGVLPLIAGVGLVATALHLLPAQSRTPAPPGRVRTHAMLALVVLGALWAPPIWEQTRSQWTIGQPGNLSKIRRSILENRGGEERVGLAGSFELLDSVVGGLFAAPSASGAGEGQEAGREASSSRPRHVAGGLLTLGASLLAVALLRRDWRSARWLTISLAALVSSIAAGAAIVGGHHAYLLTFALAAMVFAIACVAMTLHSWAPGGPAGARLGLVWTGAAVLAGLTISGFGCYRAASTTSWVKPSRSFPKLVQRIREVSGGPCTRLDSRESAWPPAVGAFLALRKEGREVHAGSELSRIVGGRYWHAGTDCLDLVLFPRAFPREQWRCESSSILARTWDAVLVECESPGP